MVTSLCCILSPRRHILFMTNHRVRNMSSRADHLQLIALQPCEQILKVYVKRLTIIFKLIIIYLRALRINLFIFSENWLFCHEFCRYLNLSCQMICENKDLIYFLDDHKFTTRALYRRDIILLRRPLVYI